MNFLEEIEYFIAQEYLKMTINDDYLFDDKEMSPSELEEVLNGRKREI